MTKEHFDLPHGDGSYKIFGMENFGNSCYCNSILQCLFHTSKFRERLLRYKYEPHERILSVQGQNGHNFSFKYEQLYQKRLKEQGKPPESAGSSVGNGSAPLTNSRPSIRNSIFGKFSTNSTPITTTDESATFVPPKKLDYVYEAGSCDALNTEQRMMVKRHPESNGLQILVTRPLPTTASLTNDTRNDNSTSSTALLDSGNSNNNNVNTAELAAPITSRLAFVVVGIPHPETALANPINPFNPNPASDQRKRSALINGPIINLDHPLREDGRTAETSLLYALKDMFEAMAENQSQIGVVSPNHFIEKLKEKNALFRQVNMHQDAHEFCNYLINETIESINLEVGASKNWCTEIFQGTITNETKCFSCETVTSKDETFLDLSIDIPPGESAYSLTYSLNNFSKLEILSHQNKFYCNTCLSLQEAVKTIKLKSTPDVLVINFKRFKYDDKLDRMVKLFDSISYPLRLRLFNTTKDQEPATPNQESKLYGLYALVVHIGGGPMHGHYVALCKCRAGLWFLFDDETIEIVDEAYVLRFFGDGPGLASAYILFYEKLDTTIGEDGETHDFGIDLNGIYNGSDYSMAYMKPSNDSNASVNNAKAADDSLVEVENDEDSVRDFLPESLVSLENSSIGMGRKTSIFKKTFMFDNKDSKENKDHNKDSISNGIAEAASKTVSRTSSNKDGVENVPPTAYAPAGFSEPKPPPPVVKKSWVNGLKRRELKVELQENERKGSQGSILTNSSGKTSDSKEDKKKRGFFSFKRKPKN